MSTPDGKDYSLYIYYKGSDEYPNDKAAFFGMYEKVFEESYDGAPEDKAEEFAAFMHDLIVEMSSDMSDMAGPGIDSNRGYEFFLNVYRHPEFHSDWWGKR